MGTTFYLPANHERLLKLVRFLDLTGTPLQIKNADLATALEMPVQAVSRFVGWAESYGIVEVTRTSNGFGGGRVANTYTLLMSYDEWVAKGPDIVAAKRVKPPAEKRVKSKPSTTEGDRELAKIVRPAAEAIAAEKLAQAAPVAPMVPLGPMSDNEVELWRDVEG